MEEAKRRWRYANCELYHRTPGLVRKRLLLRKSFVLTYIPTHHRFDTLKNAGGWHPVGEQPSDQLLSYKCEGLINKKEYKFRVVAVNKMGNSEPGVFPKVVLAKDPWGKTLLQLTFKNQMLFWKF